MPVTSSLFQENEALNQAVREARLPNGVWLQIVHGDLTLEQVDAIVNAANAYLMHGGGVAGAIVRRGGEIIQAESDAWVKEYGSVTCAEPAVTRAGKMACRYVIHAVGPVWGEGDEDEHLAAAVGGALRRADELKLASLALPAISTGIFGFPKERAAQIILDTIDGYFAQRPASGLQTVRVTIIDQATLEVFVNEWDHRND